MTDAAKAVVAYMHLSKQPREQLAELDARKLEEAELVVRELNGVELIEILRSQHQTVRL